MSKKNRHEVNLDDEILDILTNLAEKDSRKLKNYMEKILTKHAERYKEKTRAKRLPDSVAN